MVARKALEMRKMHCFEGAVFACWCLQNLGIENYLMDLKVKNLKKDSDHTLCIFRINKFWGAISKTNHSVLRWRDPIYKNDRELAMSYYHEYFLDNGQKTLKSFSKPFNIFKKFGLNLSERKIGRTRRVLGESWVEQEEDLDEMVEVLDESPHINFVPDKNKKFIRKAGKTEIKGASIVEWHKK